MTVTTINEPIQLQQPKALRFLANVISVVFHPVFMPLVMSYVIYKLMPEGFAALTDKEVGFWFISIGMTTIFFPLFSIGLLKPLGFISSFKMPTVKERIIPLMITMIFYFWISHVFNNLPNAPTILKVLHLGNFFGIVVIFIINIFTKISMHTSAAGGMLGIIFIMIATMPVNMEIPLFVSLIIAGTIGTARLLLGAHQTGDVWIGYIVGIICQLAAWLYMM